MRSLVRGVLLPALLLLGTGCVSVEVEEPLINVAPSIVRGHGMSADRLDRLTERMQAAVDEGAIAGAVNLVYRRGQEAHVDVLGFKDREAQTPMARDTIFRIYSMTKPITSVAALILVEDGVIGLHEPVAKWLPELADPKVLTDPAGPLDRVEDVTRPITVRDLLTHTSGLAYAFTSTGPLSEAINERGLFGSNTRMSPDEFMKRLGELPLHHQPGTSWHYSLSDDVLGVLIERASGMRFGEFLESRIFEPLGMEDTAFWVPEAKLDRLAVNYFWDPKTASLQIADHPAKSSYASSPEFESGGGGLVSTADDYARFARMLVGMGELDGVRILSRKTVERMTRHSLTEAESGFAALGPQASQAFAGNGFGLGVRVQLDNGLGSTLDSPGTHGWGGAAGTWYFVDPAEDLVAVMMIQVMVGADRAQRNTVRAAFDTLVLQGIID